MSARVVLSAAGPIARLELTSDDGENRIDAATVEQLREAAAAVASSREVRVLVLAGVGATFSLGWSREALERALADGEVEADPFGCIAALPQPVIAALNGAAISAGLELALACDVRVAARSTRLALPETGAGLIPLAGGTQRLPRLIGRGRALELVLLGRELDAETALAWGLVSAVTEDAALEAEVERLAGAIAARGPIAERFAKEALRDGAELPLARALRYELDLTVLLQTTEDRAEGVRAFAEKRQPRFTGR